MPFVDLSLPERERFLKSHAACHIPGYTGHCPTLKFRYGKGYGADTREIIRQLKDRPAAFDDRPRGAGAPAATPKTASKETEEEIDLRSSVELRTRPYILGYTGFIPGLDSRYGSSFVTAADECVDEFSRRMFRERKRRERDRFQCSNSTARMASVRNRDDVNRMLHDFSGCTRRKAESKISFELPPIAGYTGHIPRLIGSETSLSRRYNMAAKAGLARLKEEKDRQNHIEMAKEAVRNVIACSHRT